MRVVLDTNVVVSAALTTDGVCARILDLLSEGVFGIFADDRILAEYELVLRRPALDIAPEDAAEILEMLRAAAEPVAAIPLDIALPYPKDRPFLEAAAAANAVLVTGNTRHYPAASRAGVTVLTPREFLGVVQGAPG